MSVYSNDINLHMNELPIVEFRDRNQNGLAVVASVVMTYETLRAMAELLANAVEQHEKKLSELQRTKADMN